VQYQIIDLGTFGGPQSTAFGINASGQVVGEADDGNFHKHAFLYSAGVMTDLGTLGGVTSRATAINDSGQIVGDADLTGNRSHGFLYSGGTMTDLGTLGGNHSEANAINNAGQIVGNSGLLGSNTSHAFLSDGSQMTRLDNNAVSLAHAISNSGTAVGNAGDTVIHAVIFNGNAGTDLGVIAGGTNSYAYGINGSGVIVGTSYVSSGDEHAFIYTGTTTDLNTGGRFSGAYSINTAGDIVGDDSTLGAFLYSNGAVHSLQSLVAPGQMGPFTSLDRAYGINDHGWIVGSGLGGELGAGDGHAFLAVPYIGPSTTLVAAPGDAVFGGSSAVLSVAGPPAMDAAGEVAFHAVVKGTSRTAGIDATNNASIVLCSGGSFTLLARTGDPDPITGATVVKLSDPVLSDGGALAYIGTLKAGTGDATRANSTALYVRRNGVTALVARTGGAAAEFGASATFTGFPEIAVGDGGGLLFLANLSRAANSPSLFGADLNGGLHVLIGKGATFPVGAGSQTVTSITALAPLAGVGGQTRSLGETGGFMTALVHGARGKVAIFQAHPAADRFVTTVDDPLSGVAGLAEPLVNSQGTLVYSLTLSGSGVTGANNAALAQSSVTGYVARTGDPAPDAIGAITTAVFTHLGQAVLNDSDQIAFSGTSHTSASGQVPASNAVGVWSNVGGHLRLIVRQGDSAAGSGGGKFASFSQLVLPNSGGVIFEARLSGVPASRNSGVWKATPTGIIPLIQTGQQLDWHGVTKTVKTIGVFQVAPVIMGESRSYDRTKGNLVYRATFTDGTWGIYQLVFP
jgi:probable HAF family extracellular repeat protein